MRYKPFFLMAVLVFGLAGNPFAFSNFDNIEPSILGFDFSSSGGLVFAQTEDDDDENETEDEAVDDAEDEVEDEAENEEQAEDEQENEEESEELEIKVEIENGVADIEVKINGEETEFEMEETNRGTIIEEIALRTGLTIEEIEGVITFEVKESEESEEEDVEDVDEEAEETEIEVEVKKGKTKVKVEFEGEKSRFVLETTDESEIISAIEGITGLTEDQIKAIWEFETEEEDEELSDVDEEEKLAEKMARKESKVKQEAEKRIAELEQKIEQLEQRLQTLLDNLESGKYFGPVVGTESVPKSYGLSFDGTVSSLNDSETADVSGEIFIETLGSLEDTSKFRVTGGEIVVGDTFYDFVFGKARITSSGQSDQKDSMTIIGQIISDEGDVNTIRISLDSTMPLEGDFGLEPIDVEIIAPQSKISNQWSVSAQGQLSQVES